MLVVPLLPLVVVKLPVTLTGRAASDAKVRNELPPLLVEVTLPLPALKARAPIPWRTPLASLTMNEPVPPKVKAVPVVPLRLPAVALPTCSVPPLMIVAPS